MKQTLKQSLILTPLAVCSSLVSAHPGHDHSHWTSEPIHILTMVAIGTVMVGGVVYKQMSRRNQNKEQEK
ncbi:hypothetical protein [Marinomonas epiphytica]